MILYIVRHAWAEERDNARYPDDDLRPLTGEGRKRFGKMVDRLVEAGFAPTVIATSPLVRCRQTAELLVKQLAQSAKLVEHDALHPPSDLRELLTWTRQQSADEVAWVGHAPDVTDLAAALIGDREANIRFAKGAVAAIGFDAEIAPDKGALNWLATAKLLGC